MSQVSWALLLPMLWAIVSAAIGLILYKSSTALVAGDGNVGPFRSKEVRLTGSVAIAALVAVGLWYATPEAALDVAARDARIVPQSRLVALHEASLLTESRMAEVAACAEMTGSLAGCNDSLIGARNAIRDLRVLAETLASDR